jgi:hypothetical protein
MKPHGVVEDIVPNRMVFFVRNSSARGVGRNHGKDVEMFEFFPWLSFDVSSRRLLAC